MSDYNKIVAKNKQAQPEKCNGCRYEDTNGSHPGMSRNRICCGCFDKDDDHPQMTWGL